MQVTYTDIAKAVNEIDGTDIDYRVVQRRMESMNIKKEALTSKPKVDLAIAMCSNTRGAWYAVDYTATKLQETNKKLKAAEDEIQELKAKVASLTNELDGLRNEFEDYKLNASFGVPIRKAVEKPPVQHQDVDMSKYGYDEDGNLVDEDGNYVD